MKDKVRELFASHPTIENFGCRDCRFIINDVNTNLSLVVNTDETKSLLVEMGLTFKDYVAARDFVQHHRVVFIEEDTLIFERKDFV